MEHDMPAPLRKSTNLSLDGALVAEARRLGVNVSRAAELGVAAAVRDARRRAWQAENAEAIEACNRHVEAHGIPLAGYRKF
jgi:antitoxin CcdA